jgi:serine/threonine protein kinase
MAQPIKPDAAFPTEADIPAPRDRHDTILLGDAPSASAPAAEPSTEPAGPAVATPPIGMPNEGLELSSAVLVALRHRYDVLGAAGHGSMGDVYKARDRETGETVALKILKPEIASDQAMMDRFKNELLFARKITHKNVCRVHEFNRIGGVAYTSMEFVEGDSLRSVINRFGGLPLRKGVDVALQICSGLKEAHAQGIVHRDLKPENVMMDTQGNVKIMDFGIARSMEALTRLTGSMVGTPAYMAPEQVAGKPVDYRTDIYSLGLILYEVFTGAQAFQADNSVAVALKQMRESPAPPHEIEPAIPLPLERTILKCLEKEPTRRYQSIPELEKDLRFRAAPKIGASSRTTPAAQSILDTNLQEQESATRTAPTFGSLPSFGTMGARPEPKGSSLAPWVLMVLLIILAVAGGLHGKAIWAYAESHLSPSLLNSLAQKVHLPPPVAVEVPSAAPTAPVAAPAAATGAAAASDDQTAPPPAPASSQATAQPAPSTNAPSAQAKKKPESAASAPKPEQQPADDALPQTAAAGAGDAAAAYLWVGRYEREDRAQEAAKKIEELGLPVAVIPRYNNAGEEFYVVLSGPFDGKRVSSVADWLVTQGFPGVHPIRSPLANQKSSP